MFALIKELTELSGPVGQEGVVLDYEDAAAGQDASGSIHRYMGSLCTYYCSSPGELSLRDEYDRT